MESKTYIKATIFSGIVVAAIATFVFTPLGQMAYRSINLDSKPSEEIYDIKSKESENDNQNDNKIEKNRGNIHYLKIHEAIELFNGNLVITLNNPILGHNNYIRLKLIEKGSGCTKILKKQEIGDVIHFKDYIITLLSVKEAIFLIRI